MNPRRAVLLLSFVVPLVVSTNACVSSGSSPSPVAGGTGSVGAGRPPSDVCAGDPWLSQILGQRPALSSAMSLEGMRRTRSFAPHFSTLDRVEMDHMGDLAKVRSSSMEVYEWEGPPSKSSSTGHETARVLVARNVFGDPRAFDRDGAKIYSAPTTLPSGVQEFAPTKANVETVFAPTGGTVIYTFADGTWVQVDGWMAQRFRAVFATTPAAPPLPAAGPAVAGWEVCAPLEGTQAARSGAWGVVPQRAAMRFLTTNAAGSTGADLEMVFRFATPELAVRAADEQRQRCAAPAYGKGGDKGIFSMIPPCTGVLATSFDGPMLRYLVRL